MSASCSLSNFLRTECRLSTRYPHESANIKLNDCDRPIASHLKTLSLKQSDYSSEGELIANRCGLFDSDLRLYSVCPYHRDALGIFWQKKVVCQFPMHEGKAKPYRNISLAMSKAIFFNLGTLVPVGSGLCRKCIDQVYRLPKEEKTISEAVQEIRNETSDLAETEQSYNLRKRSDITYTQFAEGDSQETVETTASSQVSNWSEEQNVASCNMLEKFNNAITSISLGKISPLKYQLRTPLNEITIQNKNYMKRKASEVVNSLLEIIAPGQSNNLLQLITQERNIGSSNDNDKILSDMIKLYNSSMNNTVRDQILSIMAGLTTKENLLSMVPGLTKYYVDKVRAVSLDDILKKEQEPPKKRQRMDDVKLEHCLSFFFNSSFHQLVSYGTRNLEMDSGDKIAIPDIVRTACHTSIINMYEKYCNDSNFDPLSKSTLYRILHACAASKKRNLYGLDNITADGLNGFETLSKILTNLESRGSVNRQTKDDISGMLNDSKVYLKSEFKFHVSLSSSCANHCITWACSESKDKAFQSVCDHEHTEACKQCTQVATVLKLIASQDLTEDETVDVIEASAYIEAWKAHIVRTFNQDKGRTNLLENMKSNQMLVVMDWAMKFLPLRHREKQSDWFGQKGISWHVSVGITKEKDETLKHNTFIHILESGKQDWFAVASLVEIMLSSVKEQYPEVTEIFLRSDNAGCYHNGFLWTSLPGISARNGIQIKGYNFSEAQAGKSYCDAKIAHLRQKMRMYVADGHNINTPTDMKAAIDSGHGVVGCQVSVVEVDYTKQSLHCHKWKDVSFITYLIIEGDIVTAFHSYDIGEGKKIDISHMSKHQQGPTCIVVLQNFKTSEKQGKISNPAEKEKEVTQYFRCTEEGCVRSFFTFDEYEHHMYFEKHTFEMHSVSTYDKIKYKWAEKCNLTTDNTGPTSIVLPTNSISLEDDVCPQGWALKKGRKQVRFKPHVREYLKGLFSRGELSGKRANVIEVAAEMKTLTTADGKRVFCAEDCLKPSQILSYFSRLSSTSSSKMENAEKPQDVIEEDEFLEHVLQEIEMQEIKDSL